MKKQTFNCFYITIFIFLWIFSTTINAESNFDHSTTGFFLTGQHSVLPCESCHLRGIFKGLPDTCEGCHDKFSQIGGTLKPITHVRTTAACDDCHTDNTWAAVRMDHADIEADCITCHNGTLNTGKPLNHVVSSDTCDDCHLTVAWTPARFDHFGITDACVSCHNGGIALGKPVGHPLSEDTCDDCHSTHAWLPASFKHIGISGDCFSCHNTTNPYTTAKPTNHVPSVDICEDCHKTTQAWSPALFFHDETTTDCKSCHVNGGYGTPIGPGHLMTDIQCDICHYTTDWTPLKSYSHDSPNYPGTHTGVTLGCYSCHKEKTESIGWANTSYYPDCAACHANDFDNEKHEGLTVSEIPDCAGTCHKPNPEHQLYHDDWGQ